MKYVRRDFLKASGMGVAIGSSSLEQQLEQKAEHSEEPQQVSQERSYNGSYRGPHLNRVAFPIGGIGAGMICLEGTGAFFLMFPCGTIRTSSMSRSPSLQSLFRD